MKFQKKHIWQVILINLSAFVVAYALNTSSSQVKEFLSVGSLVSNFIYSFSIGTLICFSVFAISARWKRNFTVIRFAKISAAIFVATFCGVVIARFILILIFPDLSEESLIPDWRGLVFSLGMGFTFGFAFYFYETSQSKLAAAVEELRQKEVAEEKAKTLAVSAQLASLESRIHPHFLFNTLNSIAALIKENPDLAEKMVEKLSALLRYSLSFEPNKLVTLAEELKITRDYLEIESARFADKLDYKLEIEQNLNNEKLPAFALQTLVENSIKHVAAKRSSKTLINISAYNSNKSLKIEVSDNGFGFSEDEIKTGHGLDTLQKRLEHIFGNKANLKIIENETGGRVLLKLPIVE